MDEMKKMLGEMMKINFAKSKSNLHLHLPDVSKKDRIVRKTNNNNKPNGKLKIGKN